MSDPNNRSKDPSKTIAPAKKSQPRTPHTPHVNIKDRQTIDERIDELRNKNTEIDEQLLNNLGVVVPTKNYGWKRDTPDSRDIKMSLTQAQLDKSKYTNKVDLRNKNMPTMYDQGSLGSCTANAICAAYTYVANSIGVKNPDLSRMFIYYNERVMEGTVRYDAGAEIRSGIKSVNKVGVCRESYCVYNIKNFTKKPSNLAYKDAPTNKSVKYMSVSISVNDFKNALSAGYPVIFGFAVPYTFESAELASTGIMKPYNNEKIIGGHAVLACGFDETDKCVLVRNSWGTLWGDKGYFKMPYSFVESGLLSDAWILQIVT